MVAKSGQLNGRSLPKKLSTLSISWLNKEFRAVAVQKGVVTGSAEIAGTFDGPEGFSELLQRAVRETGYDGQTISLVLAHPRLVQQVTDVPPVKGAALQKVIHRQAQQQNMFPGEAAYANQFLVSSKRTRHLLLHLFPRLLLNQFTLACRRNGLLLVSVLPASAVLQRQLSALKLESSDVVALAAETAGSTSVVVADGDGRLLLARTLQDTWNADPARFAVDLNRTLLYATQQFHVTINKGVYLFGPGAAEQAPQIQRQIQVPVSVSPVEHDPFYWATESLNVRLDTAPNFLTPELQNAPQRRVFAKVVAACSVLLLAGSLALTGYSLVQARSEQATIDNLNAQLKSMETRRDKIKTLDDELTRKQQAIDVVLGERPAPKPAWLLAYLGQAVPADLVVTNFSVKREADFYRVKLEGVPQQGVKTPDMSASGSLAALKNQLSGNPFHMRLLDADAAGDTAASAKKTGGARVKAVAERVALSDWLNKVTVAVNPAAPPPPKPGEPASFSIEGVMR
jgi:hypothetical protein